MGQDPRADEHPDVAASYNNLAELLTRKGAFAEAETSSRTALAISRTALGADNPSVASILVVLGRTLHAQGRCGEAEPLLRDALAIRLAKLDPQGADVGIAREMLGACLVALRKFQEVEPILLASYSALTQQRGEDYEFTRRARSSLAKLYKLWGRPEQASAYER